MEGTATRPGTLAVIILTYNEEVNLPHALSSVAGWSDETFVLDSLSTDRTLSIAREYGCSTATNKFEDYAKQRNFALANLPITSEWVFFLDADEWVPVETKREISEVVRRSPTENGFHINRRLIWDGRWIRRGYYPCWILRLFRLAQGRCEDRTVNEQIIVNGPTGKLRGELMHEDRKGIGDWISKHNGYATREAMELLRPKGQADYQEIESRLFGTQAERRRWLRHEVWNRLPLLLRPFAYFFYRYVVRGGFLDGSAAFSYHFLHALWYRMLIDLKYREMTSSSASVGPPSAPRLPRSLS